jgi:futalosine hydrolase
MRRILVVSATAGELKPLLDRYTLQASEGGGLKSVRDGEFEICVLVTGAGMVKTAYWLGRTNDSKFDVVINAGVAGSFTRFLPGDVVSVTSDCFTELGAEDDREFISIDQLGLGSQRVSLEKQFKNRFTATLPEASGITVNTVHGNEKSIEKVVSRYQPFVESMEGAAFIYAANQMGWEAIQLRAISNKVEKRNRNAWQTELAIQNLGETVLRLLDSLKNKN